MAAGNICYYKKFGHCKFLETCKYRHVEIICNEKDCEIENCERRHPKECRYFKEFSRCKFGDYCSFRHEITMNEGNVTLEKEVETLKEKVDHLEKLIEEKDEQIKEIRKDLLNLVKSEEEDQNLVEPILNDEIMLESLNETNTSTARPVMDFLNFKCDKCSKTFSNEGDLLTHSKIVHKPEKYPCDICWEMFETERGMRNHIRRLHLPDL